MAGRTYVAGSAAVKLVPHSGSFHMDTRRELAKQPLRASVQLVADAKGFRTDARERLKAGPGITHKVKLTADLTGFKQEAQVKLDAVRLKVKVDVTAGNTGSEMQRLRAELAAARLSVTIKVEIDENGYREKLAILTRTRTQTIRVDMDSSAIDQMRQAFGEFNSVINNTTNNITSAGRSSSGLMSGLMPVLGLFVAIAAISLIPLIGQLSQALGVIALMPAAAGAAVAAIATLAIGFEGIGKAFTAKAPKNTSVASSQYQQAGALRSMAAAERSLANAQRSSVSAQKRLNDERKNAVRRLRDMNDELDSSVLNEEDARIAIIRAQESLGEAYANGSALDQREARNQVRQAEEGLDQIMKKNQDLRADTEATNKAGVEGDAGVIAAKEAVVDALDGVTAAQEGVAAAGDSMAKSTQTGTEAVNELEEALANLSPEARAFVETVRGLGDEWRDLRMEVQDNLFSGLSTEVTRLADNYIPLLKDGLSGIATEINGGIKRALDDLNSNASMENFRTIIENTRLAIGPIIDGISDLGFALGNIASIGSGFLPGIATDFASLMERFKLWTADPVNQDKIRTFIEESMVTLGKVGDFVFELGRVIGGLFSTSDEAGEGMLDSMTSSLKEFADWMNTAEGDKRMKEFWGSVKDTITSVMDAIGLAITLADKLATVLGLDRTPIDTKNGPIKQETYGIDTFSKGRNFVDQNGQAVDRDGNSVWRPGGTEGLWSHILPDFKKDSPIANGGRWLGDLFFGDDSSSPDNVYGTNPKGDELDNFRGGGGRSGGQLAPQEEDLTKWQQFKDKISGIKDTLVGEDGMSGWLGTVKVSFGMLGDKVGSTKDWVGDKVQGMKDSVSDLKDRALEWLGNMGDSFGGLGSKVGEVLGDIIDNKFPWLGTAIEGVKKWFSDAVIAISGVWDGLKNAAAAPINWIIDNVINGALKSAWDAVARVIPGLKPWDGVANVGGGAVLDARGNDGGATGYWTGGVIPGYTPGKDPYTIGVSGGEAVMRPEWQRAVGPGYVNEMNSVARREGVDGVRARMGNYAFGGVVDSSLWDAVHAAFPNATLNSAYRPGDSGYHGQGGAIDVGGPMQQVADWAVSSLGNKLAQVIWGPGPLLYNVGGNSITDQGQLANQVYAGDLPGHFDHVHMAADRALDGTSGGVVSDSDGGGLLGTIGSAIDSVKNRARSAAASAFESAASAVGGTIPDFGGSLVGGLPRAAFDGIKGALTDAIRGSSGTSSGPAGSYTPGSGPAVDQVREAFKSYGWDSGAQWEAADWIIDHESSWNPTAVNPSSGAFGLFQFLGSTKDQYLPDMNPNAGIQGAAGARYIQDRYGDPLAAKSFWEKNNWYDQGGTASGVGIMQKNVIQPERVLSPAQTASFEQLIPLLAFILPNLVPQGQKDPIPVTVTDTGTLNGQPLQGATVNPDGSYNAAPGAGTRGLYDVGPGITAATKPTAFSTTPEGRTAMSLAGTFGFGKQAAYLQSKEEPLMQLAGGVTGAMAAAAGGPEAFAAHAAQTQGAAALNIAKNFATYAPEAAGGIAESALSAVMGPLIGTVNTGMSKSDLMSTMGDVQNRAMRRSKIGRARR